MRLSSLRALPSLQRHLSRGSAKRAKAELNSHLRGLRVTIAATIWVGSLTSLAAVLAFSASSAIAKNAMTCSQDTKKPFCELGAIVAAGVSSAFRDHI